MPEHAANYDPVVSWELKNGTFNYYSRSGKKVLSSHVGKIKHPQARALAIDSTIRANQMPIKKRIARSMQAMHQSGLSFHKVGSRSRYAMMSQKAGPKDADNIASYRQVMDLATGRAIQESVKLKNGHYASRSFMSYTMAGGYPVMSVRQTYHYGKRPDGQWGVRGMTLINRTNMKAGYRRSATH